MSKKRRLQIQRNKMRIEVPTQQTLPVFYFTVTIVDDEIEHAEQVPDFPIDSTEDNSSLMTQPQWGVALHVTWYPEKPEPRSDLRYQGYLAVMDDIASRDPEIAKLVKGKDVGFAHPENARIEWLPAKGDDA